MMLLEAVSAVPVSICMGESGTAETAVFFVEKIITEFIISLNKICKKFNFFEILNIYYNYFVFRYENGKVFIWRKNEKK